MDIFGVNNSLVSNVSDSGLPNAGGIIAVSLLLFIFEFSSAGPPITVVGSTEVGLPNGPGSTPPKSYTAAVTGVVVVIVSSSIDIIIINSFFMSCSFLSFI